MVNMEQEHFESLYPEETRFEELEQMLHFIKEGNSCQVVGLPGVGRVPGSHEHALLEQISQSDLLTCRVVQLAARRVLIGPRSSNWTDGQNFR